MLGQVGDGFKIAMTSLESGRYSVAAGCVGICQGCVDYCVNYAKERRAVRPAIASFQLVQGMLADMKVETDAARMLVYRAAYLKDTGQPNSTETSIAKLYATEAAKCATTAIQVLGGSGYVDDHPVERYFRDVRVTTLYEGTSQIQKLIIGRALTGINALIPAVSAGRRGARGARRRRAPGRWARGSRSSPVWRARARCSTTPTRRARARDGADPAPARPRREQGPDGRGRRRAGEASLEPAPRWRISPSASSSSRPRPNAWSSSTGSSRELSASSSRGLRAGQQHLVAAGDRARRRRHPSRACGGMHFFNPPPLMALLEVVAGVESSERALAVARACGEAMGKHVIDAVDGPGFLVNRCNRPVGPGGAQARSHERIATIEQIDRVCRLGGGFRMGRSSSWTSSASTSASRSPLVLRAELRRAALAAVADRGQDRRRRAPRPQVRTRLLRVPGGGRTAPPTPTPPPAGGGDGVVVIAGRSRWRSSSRRPPPRPAGRSPRRRGRRRAGPVPDPRPPAARSPTRRYRARPRRSAARPARWRRSTPAARPSAFTPCRRSTGTRWWS